MMSRLIKIVCIVLTASFCWSAAIGQATSAEKKAAQRAQLSNLINSKNFVFKANFANPLRGGQGRVLTSDYDLTVSKDSVVAYLPYFGRAYLADYNSVTDGGIKCTLTNYNYKVTENKNGNRRILITPQKSNISDPRSVQSLQLNISVDGYASLQVISFNRDPISFDGMVQEKDNPKSN